MIVIALGMHRSGTSALAGLLHTNGIFMGEVGDFYPPPMKENPKGFFENKRFRNINDAILREANYRVKSFDPNIPDLRNTYLPSDYLDRMVALLKYYNNRYETWGWKDPRTCLTLVHWLSAINASAIDVSAVKIIVMLRNYEDVSKSMKKRGNKEKLYEGQFEDLAKTYHTTALSTLIDCNIPYINVLFDHLVFETNRAVDHINMHLGKNLIKDTQFIDPQISRTK